MRVDGETAATVTGVSAQPVSTSLLAQAVGAALGADTFGDAAWAAELSVSTTLASGIFEMWIAGGALAAELVAKRVSEQFLRMWWQENGFRSSRTFQCVSCRPF